MIEISNSYFPLPDEACSPVERRGCPDIVGAGDEDRVCQAVGVVLAVTDDDSDRLVGQQAASGLSKLIDHEAAHTFR